MGPVSRSLRSLFVALVILLGVAALSRAAIIGAQETTQIGRIAITGSNTDSFPSVQLQAYGMDGQGFPVDEVVFDGRTPVGTLTVFLIDAAGGITEPLPAIESAIRQYAGPGNMQEQLDYVAIYQNRAAGPQELLAPTPFHNGVGNLFITTPLAAEEGATSLYDAVIRMVELTPGLKPRPEMARPSRRMCPRGRRRRASLSTPSSSITPG